MMSLYAATQVHEAQLVAKARAAEVAKLGATGPSRIDAAPSGTASSVLVRACSAGLRRA
jgi:hypothetical protein